MEDVTQMVVGSVYRVGKGKHELQVTCLLETCILMAFLLDIESVSIARFRPRFWTYKKHTHTHTHSGKVQEVSRKVSRKLIIFRRVTHNNNNT